MFLLIYITNPSKEAAQKLCDHLLEQKLIACANVFPIESAYWWQGSIAREGEYVSIVKTSPNHWEAVKTAVEKVHSYEVPCILKIEVEANEAYEQWIVNSVA